MLRTDGVRVWVSLTTSPARLSMVKHVLSSPDLRHVSGIFLNLPDTYRPTGEAYTVPVSLFGSCSRLWVNRCGADVGPATKIIPAIRTLQVAGRPFKDIVISFDDDQFYARNVVTSLINYAAELGPRAVVGGIGNMCGHWRLGAFPAEEGRAEGRRDPRIKKVQGCYAVDVVEGFGGIAYRLGHIQPDMLTKQAMTSKNCRISDDYVISWHLAERGIGRATVYHNPIWQHICAYGREDDALHVQCHNDTKYRFAEEALKKVHVRLRAIVSGRGGEQSSVLGARAVLQSTAEMVAGALGWNLRPELSAGASEETSVVAVELRALQAQGRAMGGLGGMARQRAKLLRETRAEMLAEREVRGVAAGIRRVDDWM